MAKAKSKPLPPLPKSVFSVLGPVPVLLVPDLKAVDGEECFGLWVPDERCIKIRSNADPLTRWVTLLHEWLHVASWDSGLGLDKAAEERMCDAISAFLFAAGVRL